MGYDREADQRWINSSMRAQKTSKRVYLGSTSWCGASDVSVANNHHESNADVSLF